MRAIALAATTIAGCSLYLGGITREAQPEGGVDASGDGLAIDASNDVAVEAIADVIGDPMPDGCDPTACPGRRCTMGACDVWKDCNDLHSNVPNAGDGVYAFQSYSAWCDMTREGGGWTLVGRSVFGGTIPFGWKSPRGQPTDDNQPYVLDLSTAALAYTEGLIGTYSSGKSWATLYRFSFPSNFPSGFDTKAAGVKNGTLIFSAHQCSTYPQMLGNAGWVNHTELFYFRDNTTDAPYFGLTPTGFYLNDVANVNCGYSGKINAEQGLLMVR
jgi:hypothetical protein